ncbi:MAG TPA: glycosyl hydrolase family 8 [Polyangiaceae bacterium]
MSRSTLCIALTCAALGCNNKPTQLPFERADAGGALGSSGAGGETTAGGAASSTSGGSAPSAGASGSVGSGGSGASGVAGASGASAGGTGGTLGGGAGGDSGSAGTSASSGASGSAGAAGSGGAPVVSGPPYTFPQNYVSKWCTRPTGADPAIAKAAYTEFFTQLVTATGAGGNLRVTRPNTELDTTVSEGIGYGMILAVVMDDQPTFDALWKYEQAHLDVNGLMNWKIDPSGTVSTDGVGAATDGDEDMAWALLQADHKWHGQGSLSASYLSFAQAQIGRIWNYEVDHSHGGLLIAGDSWGMVITHNPSYFAPNQYRRFAAVDTSHDWNSVIDRNYSQLASELQASLGNLNNGLVPAWADPSGNPMVPFMGAPTYYQYDSARVPFRIAQDYCDYGEARAKTYLDKVSAFFVSQGASAIVDGYNLDGSANAAHALPIQSALFVGAAGVAAMSDPNKATFVNQVWQILATKDHTQLLPDSYYFNLSWLTFSTLMLSGNLYDFSLR